MSMLAQARFKIASEDWEFEQIHRLNYRTFVEEIPQNERSASRRLVDRFHDENTYLICVSGRRLVGMLAVRGQRPFSLDQKLPELDRFLPPHRIVCEIRLLAVEPAFRGTRVLHGLLSLLWQYGRDRGYDLGIISGTTRQLKLYEHLGFVPFGPRVGSGDAQFQPMYVTLETFESSAGEVGREPIRSPASGAPVNFLPGPVAVRPEVRRAFEQPAGSHRTEAFVKDLQATKRLLCDLAGARRVELFVGSGTLANDIVAAQLSLEGTPGVVISSGEFGNRLIDQARRFQLDFEAIELPWGHAVDPRLLRRALSGNPAPRWLWTTHCETSTGVLNDIDLLKAGCAAFQAKLCLDCISSIGTTPVNLSGVHMASCASSKGLGSYPGLSMVFHHHEVASAPARLPRYLDLGYSARHQGVPFTFSTNLLYALRAALTNVDWERRFANIAELSRILRAELTRLGYEIVGEHSSAAPGVVTIALPDGSSSARIGQSMQEAGYLLSYNSEYLLHRNWIQVCLMGECAQQQVMSLLDAFRFRVPRASTAPLEA